MAEFVLGLGFGLAKLVFGVLKFGFGFKPGLAEFGGGGNGGGSQVFGGVGAGGLQRGVGIGLQGGHIVRNVLAQGIELSLRLLASFF